MNKPEYKEPKKTVKANADNDLLFRDGIFPKPKKAQQISEVVTEPKEPNLEYFTE